MAAPMLYLTSDLARAMRMSRSMKQAAELLGMSLGALRKRALKDPRLRPLAEACISRGRRFGGRPSLPKG